MSIQPSPIDQAIAARNRPGRRPHPDPDKLVNTRRVEMPIDHAPENVIGDGPSARLARDAMTSIWSAWGAIRAAAEDPATDLATLSKLAQRALEKGLTAADRAIASIEGQISGIEKSIEATIRPPVSDTLAAEIRSHWRASGAKPTEVAKAVSADVRTASAVLGAPSYLSGLDDKKIALVRQNAVAAHASEDQAALEEAQRALGRLTAARDRSTSALAPRIALWRDPQPTAMRQLREIADA